MRLTPHGVIAGRVLDEEGEPVPNANVQVLRQQYMQGRKEIGAGRRRQIPTTWVNTASSACRPGRYFLSADIRPNSNGAADRRRVCHHLFSARHRCRGGGPIDIAPGAQLRNIDVTLAKMHTVTVRGARSTRRGRCRGNESQRNALGAQRDDNRRRLHPRRPVNPQGIFEFRSVAPGSYFVIAR